MKAKITLFLIALIMIFSAQDVQARIVKNEQSWLDKIFSNDSSDTIQKSPFSQPQKRVQNPRLRQPQNNQYSTSEEPRTQGPKQPENTRHLGRHTQHPRNDLTKNYAERIQTLRQQRMNAMKSQTSSVGVND